MSPFGLRVVVNGCFDMLHEGHISLIRQALHFSQGGTVLVLLNSDLSVRGLKGPGRPLENERVRTQKIIDLCEDWCEKILHVYYEIELFDTECDLKEKIDSFQPDMIIKGNDRPDVRTIIGSDNWNVLIRPRLKDPKTGDDYSTTRIIQEIRSVKKAASLKETDSTRSGWGDPKVR